MQKFLSMLFSRRALAIVGGGNAGVAGLVYWAAGRV